MNAEFNWWLLIVGLAVGAALVWLVLADSSRRDADLEDDELPAEANWISSTLRESGERVDPEAVGRVLRLHRAYLTAPPPDELVDAPASAGAGRATPAATDRPVTPPVPDRGETTRRDWRTVPADEPVPTSRHERGTRSRSKAAPPAD